MVGILTRKSHALFLEPDYLSAGYPELPTWFYPGLPCRLSLHARLSRRAKLYLWLITSGQQRRFRLRQTYTMLLLISVCRRKMRNYFMSGPGIGKKLFPKAVFTTIAALK